MAKLSEVGLHQFGNTIQLVGAIYQGLGKVFLLPFPEEQQGHWDNEDTVVMAMDKAEWEQFLLQTDTLGVEAMVQEKDGTVGKAILRKSQRQIDQQVSWDVFRRDGYACRYCARADVPLTVDHLVLWEENGCSIVANLLSACRKCNRSRGNMQYKDWLSSPYYLKVSEALHPATFAANRALVGTLNYLPRSVHQRSR
jgi:hypothetical protein